MRDHFGEHLRPPHGRVAVGREAVKEDAIGAAFERLQRRQYLVEDQRYGEPLRQHDAVKTLHRRRPVGQYRVTPRREFLVGRKRCDEVIAQQGMRLNAHIVDMARSRRAARPGLQLRQSQRIQPGTETGLENGM